MTAKNDTFFTTAAIAQWKKSHPDEILQLINADLQAADLYGADLYCADLQGADLQDANLVAADLEGANLRAANLMAANLGDADLMAADLRGADLREANLVAADLQGADLQDANLVAADLEGANLRAANLMAANLGDVRVWQFGPVGSRKDYLVVMQGPDLDDVRTGCFHGTLAEFETAVRQQHGDRLFGQEYSAIITCLHTLIELSVRSIRP